MRDINRIDVILEELRFFWAQNPDLRFCQIVGNVASRCGHGKDPFYLEDDKFLEELKQWASQD